MSPHPCPVDKSCNGTGKAQTSSLLPNCIQNTTWRPSLLPEQGQKKPWPSPAPKGHTVPPGGAPARSPLTSASPKDYQSKRQTVARCSLQVLPLLVNISKANPRSLSSACSSTLGRSKIWDEPATACFQPFFHAMSQAGHIWYIWYIYFLSLYLGLQWLFLFYQSVGLLLTGCSHKR